MNQEEAGQVTLVLSHNLPTGEVRVYHIESTKVDFFVATFVNEGGGQLPWGVAPSPEGALFHASETWEANLPGQVNPFSVVYNLLLGKI